MPTVEYVCDLDAPLERVWAFYSDVSALLVLSPPELKVRIEGEPAPMGVGAIYPLVFRRFGFTMRWEAEITLYEPPRLFRDRQIPGAGPFGAWTHSHFFDPLPGGRTRMIDHVHYHVPLGPLGRLADRLFVRGELDRMFAYRHRITRSAVEKPE